MNDKTDFAATALDEQVWQNAITPYRDLPADFATSDSPPFEEIADVLRESAQQQRKRREDT
ncbi:MAG TPA: hypothetical protein VML55_09670 [Planctomycetaceae bacterium]|nr:hypothetical protein [Planctomycetaceae bacterium]